MAEEQRSITSTPEGTTIDVPHEPQAEAALIQETRERLSTLKSHTADPLAVMKLEEVDDFLEDMMFNLADAEEYNCDCDERYEDFKQWSE